jgi:hypothetical protein
VGNKGCLIYNIMNNAHAMPIDTVHEFALEPRMAASPRSWSASSSFDRITGLTGWCGLDFPFSLSILIVRSGNRNVELGAFGLSVRQQDD